MREVTTRWGVVVWLGRLLQVRVKRCVLLAFWRVMWYNRSTKYRRATAMTKAKRATRLAAASMRAYCARWYARAITPLLRAWNNARFFRSVSRRAWCCRMVRYWVFRASNWCKPAASRVDYYVLQAAVRLVVWGRLLWILYFYWQSYYCMV